MREWCELWSADSHDTLAEKLRYLLEDLELDSDEALPFLLNMLGVPDPSSTAMVQLATTNPQRLRRRTFEILVQLIRHRALRAPFLIVIEDLHWIDATTEEWLAYFMPEIASMPVLLLLTYRPEYRTTWLGTSYATQIALPPLGAEVSRGLFLEVLGQSHLDEGALFTTLEQAQGNPFFLEELALNLATGQAEETTSKLPESIWGVLASRIDHLPAASKQLLQTAAVVARHCS